VRGLTATKNSKNTSIKLALFPRFVTKLFDLDKAKNQRVSLSFKSGKDIGNNGINHKCGFEQGYCQNVLLESMCAGGHYYEKEVYKKTNRWFHFSSSILEC